MFPIICNAKQVDGTFSKAPVPFSQDLPPPTGLPVRDRYELIVYHALRVCSSWLTHSFLLPPFLSCPFSYAEVSLTTICRAVFTVPISEGVAALCLLHRCSTISITSASALLCLETSTWRASVPGASCIQASSRSHTWEVLWAEGGLSQF